MTKINYADSAIVDLVAAAKQIREYFKDKSKVLCDKHLNTFRTEFKNEITALKDTPRKYRVRDDFVAPLRPYRTFNVHWFTVYYTYDKEVTIWYVRSSRSDLSNVIYLSSE
jgi:plasmid stabilization system protein ParE